VILIIDADEKRRTIIASMLEWADGRLRICTASGIEDAELLMSQKKPECIIFGDSILPAKNFVAKARSHSSKSLLMLCSHKLGENLPEHFDGVLPSPPTRITVLGVLQRLKHIRKLNSDSMEEIRQPRRNGHTMSKNAGESVKVIVGIKSSESILKFNMLARKNVAVREFLREMGKEEQQDFSLIRADAPIEANSETRMEDGDLLILDA
jgi:hypothetical protein